MHFLTPHPLQEKQAQVSTGNDSSLLRFHSERWGESKKKQSEQQGKKANILGAILISADKSWMEIEISNQNNSWDKQAKNHLPHTPCTAEKTRKGRGCLYLCFGKAHYYIKLIRDKNKKKLVD